MSRDARETGQPTAKAALSESAADFTTGIYTVGGMLYAILCMPAIGRRGYPPIDAAWMAIPYLWVAPIVMSAVIDRRSFRNRFRGLGWYCLATAFIHAGTSDLIDVVPRHVTISGTLIGMIFLHGPLHLFIGIALEGLSQAIRSLITQFITPVIPIGMRGSANWGIVALLLTSAIVFPFAFRQYSIAELEHRGRIQAEEDWISHCAILYVNRSDYFANSGGRPVIHDYDIATGLKIENMFREEGPFVLEYNARVSELLREHGIPEWSMKKHLVDENDLSAMLDSHAMDLVEQFPYEINENIILFRRGTISRWGGTMSSRDDGLSIGTSALLMGVGQDVESVSVGRLDKYPEVVFVRNGENWVGAFHESGRHLSSASRR